eukprot:gene27686-7327_t
MCTPVAVAALAEAQAKPVFSKGNAERDLYEFASFYQLPMVSLKTAVYEKIRTETFDRDIYDVLYADIDGNLNGATGARLVLDALVSVERVPFNPSIENDKAAAPLSEALMLPPEVDPMMQEGHACEVLASMQGMPQDAAVAPECVKSIPASSAFAGMLSQGIDATCTRYSTMIKESEASSTMNYQWFLPDDDRLNGITYHGSETRLRAAMDRYMNKGANLSVAFMGGSITVGFGNNEGLTYPEWAELVVRKAFGSDQDRIKFSNLGLRGTTSALMASCHGVYADPETDIFFLTQRQIFYSWQAFERLVRKLLNYKNRPAVIVNHFLRYAQNTPRDDPPEQKIARIATETANAAISSTLANKAIIKANGGLIPPVENLVPLPNWTSYGGYSEANAERDYMEYAWYYKLPAISTKAASYLLSQQGHPEGQSGYRTMGELAAQVMLDAAASVTATPFTEDESRTLMDPLPPPMVPH